MSRRFINYKHNNGDRIVEVEMQGNKILVDKNGFVHLRRTFNGMRAMQRHVLDDMFTEIMGEVNT